NKHLYFEFAHCGALMDVAPFGERQVVGMCHHIEDPTFDATVSAINPRARCRPVHRPPRSRGDQLPHCRWEVVIDDAAEPLAEPEITRMVRARRRPRTSGSRSARRARTTRERERWADPHRPDGRRGPGRGERRGVLVDMYARSVD